MIAWDSQLYLRYEQERTQPSVDLAWRIPLESPQQIIDLGCGPGNSTQVLRQRWPNAQLVGLDSSPAMIERAGQSSNDIEWRVGDIQSWSEPDRFDLIFANASLHWIADHETLTRRLIAMTKPAGVFAFQIPALYNQPASQAVNELAQSRRWQPYRLQERYTLRAHEPIRYYDWLAPISRDLQIWETVYFHEMENHQKIIEFYSSTGLKLYLEGLPSDELRDRFKSDLQESYRNLFPPQINGKVLFPFRRLFVVASR
ncbi:MAG: methyltransferase domain-containing protein [Verrucomicrobia bacterium]|nr:methyltransferase domain-containing protein [Verrucomicrobiota bacterium]